MTRRRLLPIASLSLVSLSLGAISCEKVSPFAPAGTVITMIAATNPVALNGTTDVVAVLMKTGTSGTTTGTGASGLPVADGTLVSFTTSLGRVEPAEGRTTNGRVTVRLFADGRSGTAKVTAFSGSASQTLDILLGGAATERVLVAANPTSLPWMGGSATITARVEDAAGSPVVGVPVSFSTTAGTLSTLSGTSDTAGVATTVLSTTGEATVTATAGGKAGTAPVTLRTQATVSLSVPTSAPIVGSPAMFSVTPGSGATLSNVLLSLGDGSTQSLGTVSSTSSYSYFYRDEGIFLVRVTGTAADGSQVTASGSVAVVGFSIAAAVDPASSPLGTVFSFSVTGIPDNVPIHSIEWRFGNGVTRTTNSTGTSYQYPAAGSYTATVTVRPVYGPTRTATIDVSVS